MPGWVTAESARAGQAGQGQGQDQDQGGQMDMGAGSAYGDAGTSGQVGAGEPGGMGNNAISTSNGPNYGALIGNTTNRPSSVPIDGSNQSSLPQNPPTSQFPRNNSTSSHSASGRNVSASAMMPGTGLGIGNVSLQNDGIAPPQRSISASSVLDQPRANNIGSSARGSSLTPTTKLTDQVPEDIYSALYPADDPPRSAEMAGQASGGGDNGGGVGGGSNGSGFSIAIPPKPMPYTRGTYQEPTLGTSGSGAGSSSTPIDMTSSTPTPSNDHLAAPAVSKRPLSPSPEVEISVAFPGIPPATGPISAWPGPSGNVGTSGPLQQFATGAAQFGLPQVSNGMGAWGSGNSSSPHGTNYGPAPPHSQMANQPYPSSATQPSHPQTGFNSQSPNAVASSSTASQIYQPELSRRQSGNLVPIHDAPSTTHIRAGSDGRMGPPAGHPQSGQNPHSMAQNGYSGSVHAQVQHIAQQQAQAAGVYARAAQMQQQQQQNINLQQYNQQALSQGSVQISPSQMSYAQVGDQQMSQALVTQQNPPRQITQMVAGGSQPQTPAEAAHAMTAQDAGGLWLQAEMAQISRAQSEIAQRSWDLNQNNFNFIVGRARETVQSYALANQKLVGKREKDAANMKKLREEYDAQGKRLKQCQEYLQAAQAKVDGAKNEFDRLKSKASGIIDRLKADHEKALEVAEARSPDGKVKAELAKAKEDLARLNKRIAEIMGEKDQDSLTIMNRNTEIENLQASLAEREAAEIRARESTQEAEDRATRLEKELVQVRMGDSGKPSIAAIDQLTNEVRFTKNELEISRAKESLALSALNAKAAELKTAQSERDEAKSERVKAQSERDEAQSERDEAKSERDKAQSERDEANRKLALANEPIADTRSGLHPQSNTDLADLTERFNTLQAERNQFSVDLGSIRRSFVDSENSRTAVEKVRDGLLAEVQTAIKAKTSFEERLKQSTASFGKWSIELRRALGDQSAVEVHNSEQLVAHLAVITELLRVKLGEFDKLSEEVTALRAKADERDQIAADLIKVRKELGELKEKVKEGAKSVEGYRQEVGKARIKERTQAALATRLEKELEAEKAKVEKVDEKLKEKDDQIKTLTEQLEMVQVSKETSPDITDEDEVEDLRRQVQTLKEEVGTLKAAQQAEERREKASSRRSAPPTSQLHPAPAVPNCLRGSTPSTDQPTGPLTPDSAGFGDDEALSPVVRSRNIPASPARPVYQPYRPGSSRSPSVSCRSIGSAHSTGPETANRLQADQAEAASRNRPTIGLGISTHPPSEDAPSRPPLPTPLSSSAKPVTAKSITPQPPPVSAILQAMKGSVPMTKTPSLERSDPFGAKSASTLSFGKTASAGNRTSGGKASVARAPSSSPELTPPPGSSELAPIEVHESPLPAQARSGQTSNSQRGRQSSPATLAGNKRSAGKSPTRQTEESDMELTPPLVNHSTKRRKKTNRIVDSASPSPEPPSKIPNTVVPTSSRPHVPPTGLSQNYQPRRPAPPTVPPPPPPPATPPLPRAPDSASGSVAPGTITREWVKSRLSTFTCLHRDGISTVCRVCVPAVPNCPASERPLMRDREPIKSHSPEEVLDHVMEHERSLAKYWQKHKPVA